MLARGSRRLNSDVRAPALDDRQAPQLIVESCDNTPVCKRQFCSYRDRAEDFAALDVTVIGISAQDLASHKGFIEKNSLTVPLLADVDKTVGKAYSASGKRAVIVIDGQGIVRYRHDHLLGLDYQSADDLKAALDTLPSASTT